MERQRITAVRRALAERWPKESERGLSCLVLSSSTDSPRSRKGCSAAVRLRWFLADTTRKAALRRGRNVGEAELPGSRAKRSFYDLPPACAGALKRRTSDTE